MGLSVSAERLIADGHALEDAGRFGEAQQLYQAAADAAPDSPRPWLNLGNVLHRQGRLDDALSATRRAIALAPDFGPGHYNLGCLLIAAGRPDEAETALRAAWQLAPDLGDAGVRLADVLVARGNADGACEILRTVVGRDASNAGAARNLALLLIERDRIDEAEATLRSRVRAGWASAGEYAMLGEIALRSGRASEADDWYAASLSRDPSLRDAARARVFALSARDDLSPQHVFDAHRAYAATVEGARTATALPPRRRPGRLRIGYVSPDFCSHAVAMFIKPVIEHHDRSRFEIFCYDNGDVHGAVKDVLRTLADHWRPIAALDDAAAAHLIRADGIDVLVDLAGHTSFSRVALFAHRCAPAQVTWLGYPHTTGFGSADYRICDAITDPPDGAPLASERLLRLPSTQWCYAPIHHPDPPDASARADGTPTLGSFNQFWKVSPSCLRAWIDVMCAVPAARLRLVGVPAGRTSTDLLAHFEREGVAPARLVLLPRLDVRRYFATLADTDVALDTWPYSGATTTLDALWAGTPVVTVHGDRSQARSSESILRAAGLAELVASSPREFVELAVGLASDRRLRASLRATIRSRLQASPLMDASHFTRDLEALYLRIT